MEDNMDTQSGSGGRAKFVIGGLLIVAAIVYLIYSSTAASAQYFLTVFCKDAFRMKLDADNWMLLVPNAHYLPFTGKGNDL